MSNPPSPLRVGLIGYGYWGPNVLRNVWALPELQAVAVADSNPARLREVGSLYESVRLYRDAAELLEHESPLDLVVVATPPGTHYEIGIRALESKSHVLMTKPLATNVEEARHLVREAERRDLLLMVDHTYVYTGAVAYLRDAIERGELGTPLYYSSVRVNLGLFQPDSSVIWDLMPHDLSIIQALFRSPIQSVSATAHAASGYTHWDIANATVWLESGLVAFINVSWMAPTKLRTVLIGGSSRSAVYDDIEANEKVRIYDKGVSLNSVDDVSARRHFLVQYRLGDVRIPHLDAEEALAHELRHVAACIRGEESPVTGAAAGLEVVAVLEAMEQSVSAGGASVAVIGRPAVSALERDPLFANPAEAARGT